MTLELYRRMLPLFIDEAETKLRVIYDAITALALGPSNERARQDLARAVHTIKGNAAMLGLGAIVDACERMERGWPIAQARQSTAQLAALHAGRCELRELISEVAGDLHLVNHS